MEKTIFLTQKNKDLLREVLHWGMRGSYYDYNAMPEGEDITGLFNKKIDEASEDRIKEIAAFYGLTTAELIEIISDERECSDWLEGRSFPFDDPW